MKPLNPLRTIKVLSELLIVLLKKMASAEKMRQPRKIGGPQGIRTLAIQR